MSDLEIVRGEDEQISIPLVTWSGAPMDLTGATAIVLTVAKSDAGPTLLQVDLTSGLAVSDPTGGLVIATIAAEQTRALAAGAHRYDVFAVLASGRRKRGAYGRLLVLDTPNA